MQQKVSFYLVYVFHFLVCVSAPFTFDLELVSVARVITVTSFIHFVSCKEYKYETRSFV